MKSSSRPGTKRYKDWRNQVFERDNFLCQHCKIEGKKLHPHHIIKWDDDESLRYEVSNGLTLCTSCHNKHHHVGRTNKYKGIPLTAETKAKMSISLKGNPAWNKGKKSSAETKEKLRISHLGKKASAETRLKMSESGKLVIHTAERNAKISAAKKGKKFTQEHRDKLSKAFKGMKAWNKGMSMKEKYPNWGKRKIKAI